MKCNNDCLNCDKLTCKHDVEDIEELIQDNVKRRNKKRKAEYYKKNKTAIDAKQKEYNATHDRTESSHRYYMQHKKRINENNTLRYLKNREERQRQAREYYQAHKEEISARRKELRQQRKENIK